jgi:hypothetical protein
MAGVLAVTAGRPVPDFHRFAFQLNLRSPAGTFTTVYITMTFHCSSDEQTPVRFIFMFMKKTVRPFHQPYNKATALFGIFFRFVHGMDFRHE